MTTNQDALIRKLKADMQTKLQEMFDGFARPRLNHPQTDIERELRATDLGRGLSDDAIATLSAAVAEGKMPRVAEIADR
ncbi:MAG: hypothetical protein NTW76_02100 [Corynebacteriales bacterium]|nr:hypothetical protein [Mycobacteriales bacterium]